MSALLTTIFSYEAQSNDGRRLAGTIDAANVDAAMGRLQALQLRVMKLEPASAIVPRGRALGTSEFLAFNQQLAQLTRSGLPVEQGLRLIAGDLRRGRLARAIGQVADALEQGVPLADAFAPHRGQFPPLYGRLIDAGIRSGDLPSVLLGLGRHLEMVQRLRATLGRAISYPLMVMVGLALVTVFLSVWVIPVFGELYASFHQALPWPTQLLMSMSRVGPVAVGLLLALVLVGPFIWAWLRLTSWGSALGERIVLPLPLIGPVLRASLAARWCDATKIAIDAGLDLPAAIELASDATGSNGLQADGRLLIDLLRDGSPLTSAHTKLLPPSVPAAIEFASAHNDLSNVMATLAEMYQRQAELRVEAIPSILTPLLLIFMAASIGFVLVGLLLPVIRLIDNLLRIKI